MNVTLIEYEYAHPDEEIERHFEVIPCPFCKSEKLEFHQNGSLVAVSCNDCAAHGPVTRDGYGHAADLWNQADPCINA